MNGVPSTTGPHGRRLLGGGSTVLLLLFIGAGCAAGMLRAFAIDPARAFHSYLTAYAFALSLVLGCMGFVMISHAANTTWPVAVRRIAEAAGFAMPLLLVLFIPVAVGLAHLYPWSHPDSYAGPTRRLLLGRMPYMTPGPFLMRAFGSLLLWSVLAWLLRRWSLAMDEGEDAGRCARKLRLLSSFALPLASLTAGFSAFDWLMSLSADFASTMYAAMWLAICLFGGIACTIVLCAIAARSGMLAAAGPSHYSALGRLLLAFLMFLGYCVFFQYLLCWSGNKPFDAAWYVARSSGPYVWVSLFLVLGHFFLPFFALLSYRLKRSPGRLLVVATWCLFSQYLHIHWLVTPSSTEPGFSWLDPLALAAVLSLCVGFAVWLQRGKPLVAAFDPKFVETLVYESR